MKIDEIRSAIARDVAESRAINREILASSGPARDAARRRKRDLGRGTRALLLAYALLRDVPYLRVESARTRERPDPYAVSRAADPADPRAALARVKAWLATGRSAAAAATPAAGAEAT